MSDEERAREDGGRTRGTGRGPGRDRDVSRLERRDGRLFLDLKDAEGSGPRWVARVVVHAPRGGRRRRRRRARRRRRRRRARAPRRRRAGPRRGAARARAVLAREARASLFFARDDPRRARSAPARGAEASDDDISRRRGALRDPWARAWVCATTAGGRFGRSSATDDPARERQRTPAKKAACVSSALACCVPGGQKANGCTLLTRGGFDLNGRSTRQLRLSSLAVKPKRGLLVGPRGIASDPSDFVGARLLGSRPVAWGPSVWTESPEALSKRSTDRDARVAIARAPWVSPAVSDRPRALSLARSTRSRTPLDDMSSSLSMRSAVAAGVFAKPAARDVKARAGLKVYARMTKDRVKLNNKDSKWRSDINIYPVRLEARPARPPERAREARAKRRSRPSAVAPAPRSSALERARGRPAPTERPRPTNERLFPPRRAVACFSLPPCRLYSWTRAGPARRDDISDRPTRAEIFWNHPSTAASADD